MNNKKDALGKGIRALLDSIDTSAPTQKEETTVTSNTVNELPLEFIEVNPFQPRVDLDETRLNELADSIKIHGVIQPITVKKLSAKKYQLIAGERRLRASKMAGLTTIPAFIRTANDQEMLEIALIENTHREDLNAHEVAINYKRLMDECNLTQEDLAERVGKDRATVANYLRLLKLPPDIQLAIKNRTISMTHARAIISTLFIIVRFMDFHPVSRFLKSHADGNHHTPFRALTVLDNRIKANEYPFFRQSGVSRPVKLRLREKDHVRPVRQVHRA